MTLCANPGKPGELRVVRGSVAGCVGWELKHPVDTQQVLRTTDAIAWCHPGQSWNDFVVLSPGLPVPGYPGETPITQFNPLLTTPCYIYNLIMKI